MPIKSSSKIRVQLNMMIALSVCLMLFLFFYTYFRTYTLFYSHIDKTSAEGMKQLEEEFNTSFSQLQEVSFSLQYNSRIQSYLENSVSSDGLQKYELNQWVKSVISSFRHVRKDIYDIAFITQEKWVYYNESSVVLRNILKKHDVLRSQSPFEAGMVKNETKYNDEWYFYVSMPIYSLKPDSSQKKIGVTIMLIESEQIDNRINSFKLTEGTRVYLLDQDMQVLSSTQPDELYRSFKYANIHLSNGKQTIDDVNYMVYVSELAGMDLKIVSLVPLNDVFRFINHTRNVNIVVISIGILAMLALSFIIIRSITLPIGMMIKGMKKIKMGDLNIRLSMPIRNEISVLAEGINLMLDQVQSLTQNIINNQNLLFKSEYKKKQAELLALQSQINPHFLYNTLENIRSIAVYYNIYEIEKITVALSNILRFSIKEADVVPISKEIKNLKDYVTIQNIRFNEKYNVDYQIDPQLESFMIPKLTLQPIVENAVVHGLSPKLGSGNIWIGVKENNGKITISVTDDGVGISENSLLEIRQLLGHDFDTTVFQSSEKKGIGITNVYMRLKLIYEDIECQVNSKQHEYTMVEFTIPKLRRIQHVQDAHSGR